MKFDLLFHFLDVIADSSLDEVANAFDFVVVLLKLSLVVRYLLVQHGFAFLNLADITMHSRKLVRQFLAMVQKVGRDLLFVIEELVEGGRVALVPGVDSGLYLAVVGAVIIDFFLELL